MQPQQTTTLPSIHTLLQEISLDDKNDIRIEQQQANLNLPQHITVRDACGLVKYLDVPTPLEPEPILMNEERNSSISNNLFARIPKFQNQHRSPRNLHSRSFSDYTHPYPTTSPPHSTGNKLAPIFHHRRAISTNTLDLILQPLSQKPFDQLGTSNTPAFSMGDSKSATNTTSNGPQSPIGDDHSYASDDTHSSSKSISSPTLEPTTEHSKIYYSSAYTMSTAKAKPVDSNKYSCSYCSKGFSRPSSLRIHTYSHTGERPFDCPVEGCPRRFSVQSNMRRHLRVHRLGKPSKRNGGVFSTVDRPTLALKPLAAKPTSNWIGHSVYSPPN